MIKVPRNLEAALQKVRQLPEVRSGMKVWVDALCIDQDSVEERNQQVSLMKEIYRYAATAVAWLGPHESWTDRAVNAIVNIDYLRRYRQHQHPSGAAYERWRTRHPWDDIRMLFQANYWTRLWVLQELALNQHRTLFLLGSRQLSRRMLISAAELCMDSAGILAAETSQAVLTGKNLFRSETLTAASQVFRLLQLNTRILEQKLNAVANVLNLSQNAKCKDPRDKVYGLLGLIPKEYRIPPDYRRTPSDLYMHFAEILLARGGMTDLLAWCGIDDNTDLPSWVPNWFEGFPRNHVEWLRRYKAGAPPMATVDMPGPLTPASVKSLLQCSCVVVDRISTTSARPSDYLPFHMTVDRRIGQCPGGSKVMTPNRYGSQTEVLMALQRTLVIYDPCRKLNAGVLTSQTAQADSALLCNIYWRDWGRKFTGKRTKKGKWIRKCFRQAMGPVASNSFFETFDRFRQTNASYDIFDTELRDFFPPAHLARSAWQRPLPQISPSELDWPERYKWLQTYPKCVLTHDNELHMAVAVLSLAGRRLATTRSGYLALVPEHARSDDVLAVLRRCNFPVVLRQVEPTTEDRAVCQQYRYIGECYVDGLMNGEALEAVREGELMEGIVYLV